MKIYHITAVAKPRQTRSDKWKKRPCVMRYRAFADELRAAGVELPDQYHITIFLPMPKSWSKKRRLEMDCQPHRQKPDKDNLEKAILDSLYGDDSHVWDGRVTKRWGQTGRMVIESISD